MRWLPNRERPQHWALRLFQIAQGTFLSVVFVIIATNGQSVGPDRLFWFWCEIAVIAWIIFCGRLGWAVTLMTAAIGFVWMIPVISSGFDAEWILVERLIGFGVVGLAMGGFLDAIGLATATGVEYSDSPSSNSDSSRTLVDSNKSTSSTRGDEK